MMVTERLKVSSQHRLPLLPSISALCISLVRYKYKVRRLVFASVFPPAWILDPFGHVFTVPTNFPYRILRDIRNGTYYLPEKQKNLPLPLLVS